MALKLGELLIANRLLTNEQLEQALQQQQQFGGKLGTNLVELGFITETALAWFLSEQLKMPAAKPDDFVSIPKTVLALVPKETAAEHRVIPLRLEKRLTVAISDAHDLGVIDALAFTTGKSIQPVIAPEIWIVAALERYYQVPRQERFIVLEGEAETRRAARPDGAVESGSVASQDTAVWLQAFVDRLLRATTKNDVFIALLDYLVPFFPGVAVYVVRKENLTGLTLRGFPVHAREFQKVWLPMAAESVFGSVLEKQAEFKGALPPKGAHDALTDVLAMTPRQPVEIWPIVFRGKGVAAVLGVMDEERPKGEKRDEMLRVAFAKAGLGLELGALRHVISEIRI
jgi:hypothetical protein